MSHLFNQLKKAAESVSALVLILTLSFGVIGCASQGATLNNLVEQPSGPLFYGINRVPAAQLQQLFPTLEEQPVLVEFSSKLCRECIEMEPVIQDLQAQHPDVRIEKLDVARDKESKKAVIEAFKPTIVPVLVFIKPNGEIKAVLYGYHKRTEVEEAFAQLDV